MIVPDDASPSDFVVARVRVPTLHVVNNQIVDDEATPREVTVALLALHVVVPVAAYQRPGAIVPDGV